MTLNNPGCRNTPQAAGVAAGGGGDFGQRLSGLMTRVIAYITATLSKTSTLELSSTTTVICQRAVLHSDPRPTARLHEFGGVSSLGHALERSITR